MTINNGPAGAGIVRVIWLVSPPLNSTVRVTPIIGGLTSTPIDFSTDAQLTFDIVP
jgi:hypothetical protein